MKKKLFLLVFCGLNFVAANSQTTFEVPKNVVLKSDADFVKYEKDIINAAKWLEETDLNKETEKRKEVNAFIIKWISKGPTITVEVTETIEKIYGNNSQLLALYLASYSRNYLELKEQATKKTAAKAGIISMINVYKKGIEITKSKEMEKVIKLQNETKLDEYIAQKL